jgi:hypothetical protein
VSITSRSACCAAKTGPDHTTIARFRAEHHDGFADLFAQVLQLCAAAGMVKVGVVSIDGTKIAANAAKAANRSHEWLRDEAERIAAAVIADADAIDASEDAAARGGSDDDLPPGFATRKGRAANIKKALDELGRQAAERAEADAAERERAVQILARAETEPMPGPVPAGVDPVAYQQARTRRFERLITEQDGVRGPVASTIRRDARRALNRAQAELAKARIRGGLGDVVNTTDPQSRLMTEGSGGGSVQGYNAQIAVTDDHLILGIHVSQDANDTNCYTPTLDAATVQATALDLMIGTVLADAGYFTDDNLLSPGPTRLIAPGKNRDVHTEARDNPAAGPPSENADPKDAMRHRVREPGNAQLYKRRSATVEPVIAHLKDQTRLRRFARRGLQAATAELNLAAAVVNLTRLHNAASAPG